MNASKFALWRACFSFCYEDSHLSEQENKWIQEKLAILKFTAEQRQQIERDLKKVPPFVGLIPMITDPADRGLLVNYIRQLAVLDGNASAIEKTRIEEVKNAIMNVVDGPELLKQLKAVKTLTEYDVKKHVDPLTDRFHAMVDLLEIDKD